MRLFESLSIVCAMIGTTPPFCVQADQKTHAHQEYRVQQPQRHSERKEHGRQVTGQPASSYRHYYKPGYRVVPLPRGYSRVAVNKVDYFYFDGYFYLPANLGYVVVAGPIGAIVSTLPQLHRVTSWQNETYFAVGQTYFRKHPKGYIVVPPPGSAGNIKSAR